MPTITVIEDDQSIREELALLLENSGYHVRVVDDFVDVAKQVAAQVPDLILLDIGLPAQDGFALCTELRRASQVPIIFVTSHDTSIDELKALSLGGDDFISKPYNIPILLARIQAILRRGQKENADTLTTKGLTLHLTKASMEHEGTKAELTKNECRILWRLMQTPGVIASRAAIIEYLWDNQVYIDDNTLSVNMTRLRAKLRDIGLEDYIQTKRGMGYMI